MWPHGKNQRHNGTALEKFIQIFQNNFKISTAIWTSYTKCGQMDRMVDSHAKHREAVRKKAMPIRGLVLNILKCRKSIYSCYANCSGTALWGMDNLFNYVNWRRFNVEELWNDIKINSIHGCGCVFSIHVNIAVKLLWIDAHQWHQEQWCKCK